MIKDPEDLKWKQEIELVKPKNSWSDFTGTIPLQNSKYTVQRTPPLVDLNRMSSFEEAREYDS